MRKPAQQLAKQGAKKSNKNSLRILIGAAAPFESPAAPKKRPNENPQPGDQMRQHCAHSMRAAGRARQLDQTTKTARKSRFFLEKRAFLWYNKHRKQVQTYSSGAADQRQRMRTGAGAAAGTLDRKPADRAKTRPTAAAAGCPAG